MTAGALVSIVTPTLDRGVLLRRLWRSLQSQTEQRFRWIIVDGRSSDGTADVVRDFDDSRITFIVSEHRGCNVQRTVGEREVDTPYVVFLDSDDELYDDRSLEVMVREIEESPDDVGTVAFTVAESHGREVSFLDGDRVMLEYDDIVCERRARGEFLMIFKQSALAVAPWPDFNGMEVLRHWRIAAKYKVMFIDRPTRIYHTNRDDNLTGARGAIARAEENASAIRMLIDEHGGVWQRRCPSQIGRYLFYEAMHHAIAGQTKPAWRQCVASLRQHGPRRKIGALMLGLLLPSSLRRRMFVVRAERRSAHISPDSAGAGE